MILLFVMIIMLYKNVDVKMWSICLEKEKYSRGKGRRYADVRGLRYEVRGEYE